MVTRKELHNIAGARLDEIFHLVRAELRKLGKEIMLPGGVVLTGGGSTMRGIVAAAEQILGMRVRLGQAHPEQIEADERWLAADRVMKRTK